MADPRVILVQSGARRDYELAHMLERTGSLARLNTTSAWVEGHVSLLDRVLARLGGRFASAAGRRRIAGIPAKKIRTSVSADIARQAGDRFFPDVQSARKLQNYVLGRSVTRDGLNAANILFSVDGNGGFDLLRKARDAGLLVVSDIIITPLSERVVAEEQARWPDLGSEAVSDRQVALFEEHNRQLIALSDILICPSATVEEGVLTLAPDAADRIVRIPYGLGGYEIGRGTPRPGRVLFAGSGAIRKGLPYLGQAATLLKSIDPQVEVVVAGDFADSIRHNPLFSDLTFLGRLPRDAMMNEFAKADLFCLPSLAEGSAGVCLEALATGVPLVVTKEAGAPIEHDKAGLIVPKRDADALAQAIARIVNDRQMRDRMSETAIRGAADHKVERLAERLHVVLSEKLEAIDMVDAARQSG
ncbi:glycosyltransferase family 4 protein [Aurantiacibacter sediminis]|uniref:Glycosyltransferase family 4 protein n=1 Tax=Aurantiacibacter sediminis TaxID=2793064 RepID=A0ABS0N394_9SPHN|nr:glycosyltransferase family 4 protein [Aurantiacibacter sediminis]MBH5322441.1 glycosyltransferase family 4 protein [Aurantiacibacter sediminis]